MSDRSVPTSAAVLRRVALSSMLGTAVEYYDFMLYATMTALVFDRLFFAGADPGMATVAAFGTFAVGYVARPFGGIVFGHFGDRLGRKRMLVTTMALMGVVSFLIGVLPTYAMVGVAAPTLLVILRVVQGIAVGGEWGGATLMVAEHADPVARGRWNGLMQLGGPLGGMVSTAVVTGLTSVLSEDALLAWGWRVPFLFSAVLLAIGLYVRVSVTESPVFQQAAEASTGESARVPLRELLRKPRTLILASAVGIGPFGLSTLMGSYMISYAKGIGYAVSDVMTAYLIAGLTGLVAIPLCSALSDVVGRRKVVLFGAVGIVLYGAPFYLLVDTRSYPLLILALIVAQLFQSAMWAPLGPLLSEMFDTEVRCTGVSLGYQMSALIGAGFAPLIASSLVVGNLRSAPLIGLVIGCGVITILAIWQIRETRGTDLTDLSLGGNTARPGALSTSPTPDPAVG
jgi:MFS family permease